MDCNDAGKLADTSFGIQQDFGLEGYAYFIVHGAGTFWTMTAIG